MKGMLRYRKGTATILCEDYRVAIAVASDSHQHGRSEHMDIRCHFMREKVAEGTIKLKCCPLRRMLADILTKGLSSSTFERLEEMRVVQMPSSCNR